MTLLTVHTTHVTKTWYELCLYNKKMWAVYNAFNFTTDVKILTEH